VALAQRVGRGCGGTFQLSGFIADRFFVLRFGDKHRSTIRMKNPPVKMNKIQCLPTPPDAQGGFTRREFLTRALGAAALLGFPTIIPATALGRDGKAPPSERVLVGVIGCGVQGRFVPKYEQGGQAEIVALADPCATAIRDWKAKCGPERVLREYVDFRELLTSDVDLVHIATGDYWHVPMALMAARAGKHMYVEKPLALSIEQALACREIGAEHNVQFQYGTQQRTSSYTRGVVELLINGHIGEVKEVFVFAWPGHSGGACAPTPVPSSLDYQMWLGPAPDAPYCPARVKVKGANNAIFNVYDYTIGFIGIWGAHPYDQFQWWLDEENLGMPVEVQASGTIPTEGFFDTVSHWDAQLRYPGGLEVRFCDNITIHKYLPKLEGFAPAGDGVLYLGSKGWLFTSRDKFEASSREILQQVRNPGSRRVVNAGAQHTINLIDAVLGKNKTVTNVESAIRSDISCHLVDLAIRHGGKVGWDAAANTITGNEPAKLAMRRPMREPWNVLNPKYTS
jgi:predicted dehydrogenase